MNIDLEAIKNNLHKSVEYAVPILRSSIELATLVILAGFVLAPIVMLIWVW